MEEIKSCKTCEYNNNDIDDYPCGICLHVFNYPKWEAVGMNVVDVYDNCENCEFGDIDIKDEPCDKCYEYNKWQPETVEPPPVIGADAFGLNIPIKYLELGATVEVKYGNGTGYLAYGLIDSHKITLDGITHISLEDYGLWIKISEVKRITLITNSEEFVVKKGKK